MNLRPISLGIGISLVAACSNSAESTNEAQDYELRSLTATEVLGTIWYSETKVVSYSEDPLYRAYRFAGKKDEDVDIRVHTTTPGTDPIVWLLGSNLKTIQRNDNENESTRDSRIKTKLGKDDTYYIVVREANRENATLEVSLSVSIRPSKGVNLFALDAPGAPLSADQLFGFLARGSATAKLGSFVMANRSRDCTAATGCSAWTVSKNVEMVINVTQPGESVHFSSDRAPFNGRLLLGLYKSPSPEPPTRLTFSVEGTWGPYDLSSFDSVYLPPSTMRVNSFLSPARYVALVGHPPLDIKVDAESYRGATSGATSPDLSGAYHEVEYGLYGRINPNETVTLREAEGTVYADWQ